MTSPITADTERFGAQTVHHFPDYGHWLPIEAPDAVAAKLELPIGAMV
jgi:pimeloyl-ACP methyl ester carboxylesterase